MSDLLRYRLRINDTTDSSSLTSGAIQVAGGVGIAKSLNVGSSINGPTINYASSHSLFLEDMLLTTVNTVTLSGAAAYLSGTTAPNYSYFTLAGGAASTYGQAFYQVNPGAGFTIDFDLNYSGTNDGMSCSFFQSSVPSDCYTNNGGYVVSFNYYQNSIIIVPPGVSSARSGTTGIVTSSSTFTSNFAASTWVPVSITYRNGYLAVYVNGNLVNSYKTTTPAIVSMQGTYVAFSAFVNSTSTYYSIRNMRLSKSLGFFPLIGSGNLAYNLGTVSIGNTTDSLSTTTGALQIGGGVGIAKSLQIGTSATSPSFIGSDLRSIDTMGGYETTLLYPPTGNQVLGASGTSTVSGLPYGNGTYYIQATSIVNSSWQAYKAFVAAPIGQPWSSASKYNGTTGAYTGSSTTTDVVTTNVYSGEFIEIQLPQVKYVTSVTIYPRISNPTNAPTTFAILGSSTTNSNYKVVYLQSTAITWTESTAQTFTLTIPGLYNWIRIVGMTLAANQTGGSFVQFSFSFMASNPYLSFTNTFDSTSPTTGAIQIAGGVGIAKSLWVGTTLNTAVITSSSALTISTTTAINTTTDSSSTITGALQVAGGVGYALYAGNYFSNSLVGDIALRNIVASLRFGTGTSSSLDVLSSGYVVVNNTTDSISATTGSFQVAGGVGIAKSLTIGTSSFTSADPGPQGVQLYPPSGFNFSTDTQTLSSMPYGNGTYTFAASSIINSSYNSGQVLQGTPSTAGGWASANVYSTTTGAYTGSTTTVVFCTPTMKIDTLDATNLLANDVPLGIRLNTSFASITDGISSDTTTLRIYPPAGVAFTTSPQTLTGLAYGNGTYTFTSSSQYGAGFAAPYGFTRLVGRNSRLFKWNWSLFYKYGSIYRKRNTLTVSNTTDSTSTTTGGLQVAGGVGVAKAIYAGESVNILNTTATSSFNFNDNRFSPGAGGAGISKYLNVGSEVISYLTSGYGQFRAVYGNYGALFRNDGVSFYLMATASDLL
ncbi:unnamed protein product [Sphagnum tenellum]